jgi:hypothetical protein
VFSPSEDPEAWDADGVLTGQPFEADGTWYMVYAGKQGTEWQTGLARARDSLDGSLATSGRGEAAVP